MRHYKSEMHKNNYIAAYIDCHDREPTESANSASAACPDIITRIVIAHVICETVFTLPHICAATTTPLLAATDLNHVASSSRPTMTITAHEGIPR